MSNYAVSQTVLTFSSSSGGSHTASEIIISEAYSRLNIPISIVFNPAERSLQLSNRGLVDGEVFRKKGIDKIYRNLIFVPIQLNIVDISAFVTNQNIAITQWDDLRPYRVGIRRGVKESLIPHIEQGNWTERTITKLASEKTEITTLIAPEYSESMDWPYFDLVSQRRLKIPSQVNRALEIVNYHQDLETAQNTDVTLAIPITVIDSDFESVDIAEAEKDFIDHLKQWQEEGTSWSKTISEKSGGEYIPLEKSDHMVVFQHPSAIINALKKMQ